MLMKKQTIQSIFIFAHFCLMMIFLGGVFIENFISLTESCFVKGRQRIT